MTKKKVVVTKWLCVAFALLAFQFFIVGIAILFEKSLSHLAGSVSIAGGTYRVPFVKKIMAGVIILCQIGFLISFSLFIIEMRERKRREAVHQQDNLENDVSAWPPAPRIDRQ